jgi:hypothetical protein
MSDAKRKTTVTQATRKNGPIVAKKCKTKNGTLDPGIILNRYARESEDMRFIFDLVRKTSKFQLAMINSAVCEEVCRRLNVNTPSPKQMREWLQS